MSVLVLAEHGNAQLDEATARAVSAALGLGNDIHVLVAGKGCHDAAWLPPASTASPRSWSRMGKALPTSSPSRLPT